MRHWKLPIVVAILLAILILLLGLAFDPVPEAAAQTEGEARTITVVGVGTVSPDPDMAQVNIGVNISGPTVQGASQTADDIMTEVIAALLAEGIAETDIQTAYFNIWTEQPYNSGSASAEGSIYHVSNTALVTIRELANVGPTLQAAIEAGANTINSIDFAVADRAAFQAEARELAVADARERAEALAMLTDVALGEVVRISEVVDGAMPFAAEGVGGGPIVPGAVDVTLRLQVTYAIE